MTNKGDIYWRFKVGSEKFYGLGSFHKTLKHNEFGEVDQGHFQTLVAAMEGTAPFSAVYRLDDATA